MSGLESATLDVRHVSCALDTIVDESVKTCQQHLEALRVGLGCKLRVQGAQLVVVGHVGNFRQAGSRAVGLRRPCGWLA